jgi:hypothetical protein
VGVAVIFLVPAFELWGIFKASVTGQEEVL